MFTCWYDALNYMNWYVLDVFKEVNLMNDELISCWYKLWMCWVPFEWVKKCIIGKLIIASWDKKSLSRDLKNKDDHFVHFEFKLKSSCCKKKKNQINVFWTNYREISSFSQCHMLITKWVNVPCQQPTSGLTKILTIMTNSNNYLNQSD